MREKARTKQKTPHILFAASGSDSVWHPTACQGGLIPYWYLALTGFPFARLSFSAQIVPQYETLPTCWQSWLSELLYFPPLLPQPFPVTLPKLKTLLF